MSRSGTPSRALEEKRAGTAARGHDVQRPLRQLCKKAAQPERSPLASNHTRGVEFWLVAVKTENLWTPEADGTLDSARAEILLVVEFFDEPRPLPP